MKIKSDFVTNSSSVCYIISVGSEEEFMSFKKYVAKLDKNPEASNEGVRIYNSFRNKIELDNYTNNGPLDWAALPRGPRYENMSESTYMKCLERVKDGGVVIYMACDWNVNEILEKDWEDYIVEILQ